MKKKGFTLIELLAVIVVLAIIALITVPMVLGVMEKAKKGAFRDNVYGLMESTDIYIAQHLESGTIKFTCDGSKCKTESEDLLSFKGNVPQSGAIIVDNKQQTKVEYITDGVYCAYGTLEDLIIDKGCSNIDITAPEIDESKLILSSTTNSITVKLLEGFARDPESGIKKYKITVNGETKESDQIGDFIFKKLTKNKNYEITIEVMNGKDLKSVIRKEIKTLEFTNPNITLINTPTTSINGYLKKQVASINYNNSNSTLEYFVKTTRTGTSSVEPTGVCGTDTMPGECSSTSGTTLSPNTWYRVNTDITVTYNVASSTTGTIYAIVYDGTNYSGAATATINKIDATSPTLTLGTPVSKTDSIVIPITTADTETGVNIPTCKYGTASGSYTMTASSVSTTACSIKNIKENTDYYYQICVTDKVGNSTCKTGNAKTNAITNPSITLTNTPGTAINGYLQSQVANITYNGSNISSPQYFVKTTRQGISSLAVTQVCGTETMPSTCSNVTSTTTLSANTWYKVSGNLNVTYNVYSDTTATLYAITYDGTNYSGAITSTISKITKQTNYQVRHYLMDTNGTSYTLKDVDNLTGTAHYSVTPSLKSYTGFTAPSAKTVTLAEDGSTKVDYYYTRNKYNVTLNKGTGISSVNGAGSYYYGASVTISATIASKTAQYTYGWSNWTGTYSTQNNNYTFTMPAGNVSMTANGTQTTNVYSVVIRICNMDVYGNYPNSSWVWINTTAAYGTPINYVGYNTGNLDFNEVSYSTTVTGNIDKTLYASRKKYYLDLNGYLDNAVNGAIGGYGSADVYINGTIVANDVADYNQSIYYGSSYQITDIKVASGHVYNGVYAGSLSGTITGTTSVFLSFSTTYTISYNANGGSGAPGSQTKVYGKNLTLSSTVPTRSGWNFVGWNTSNTATSAAYGKGGTYTSNSGATLYAIWSKTITLSFKSNGTTGTTVPSAITKTVYNGNSATFKIPTSTPYLDDAGKATMQFNRWITSDYFNSTDYTTGYKPGSNITISSDTILYGSYFIRPYKSHKFYSDTNLNSATNIYSISMIDSLAMNGLYYSNWGWGVDDVDGVKRAYIKINGWVSPFECSGSSITGKTADIPITQAKYCQQYGVYTSQMLYLRRRPMYD